MPYLSAPLSPETQLEITGFGPVGEYFTNIDRTLPEGTIEGKNSVVVMGWLCAGV